MGGGYEGKSGVSEAAVGEGEGVFLPEVPHCTRTGVVFKRVAKDPHGTATGKTSSSP